MERRNKLTKKMQKVRERAQIERIKEIDMALALLVKKGYITIDETGLVRSTAKGTAMTDDEMNQLDAEIIESLETLGGEL